jgi:hypothetical protein
MAVEVLIGHGISSGGKTFYLPGNAEIEIATDLLSRGLSVANIGRLLDRSNKGALCFFPNGVVAAFSNSDKTAISQIDASGLQAADSVIGVLRQPQANLLQFIQVCAAAGKGLEAGSTQQANLAASTPGPAPSRT